MFASFPATAHSEQRGTYPSPATDRLSSSTLASAEIANLRILAVIPGDGRGFNFAQRQTLSLEKLGVEVRTFFLLSRTAPVLLIQALSELRRLIRRFRPHVIHAHYGTVTSFLCAISTTTPLVITFRGSDLQNTPANVIRSAFGQLLSQLSGLRASQTICVSPALRDRLWLRRDRAYVFPDGIDLERFQPYPRNRARALLGWDPELPIVLFSGTDRPELKGLSLVRSGVQVAQSIVGPIQLKELHTASYPFEMMPYCLSAADCLAFGSVKEGSPNIIKEAVACNLPIVSTDVGDVAQRLMHVNPSRIVPRNSIAFGKAIAEILAYKSRSDGRQSSTFWTELDTARMLLSIYNLVRHQNGQT